VGYSKEKVNERIAFFFLFSPSLPISNPIGFGLEIREGKENRNEKPDRPFLPFFYILLSLPFFVEKGETVRL